MTLLKTDSVNISCLFWGQLEKPLHFKKERGGGGGVGGLRGGDISFWQSHDPSLHRVTSTRLHSTVQYLVQRSGELGEIDFFKTNLALFFLKKLEEGSTTDFRVSSNKLIYIYYIFYICCAICKVARACLHFIINTKEQR